MSKFLQIHWHRRFFVFVVEPESNYRHRANHCRGHDQKHEETGQNGQGSEVLGKTSEVKVRNTAKASKHVIEYPTRSPLSVGKTKTAEFSNNNIITGINIVRTKYEERLSISTEYLSSA